MVPPMVLGGAAPPASACWGGRARGGVRGGACALALPAGGPCVRRRQARLGLQGKPVLGRARSGVTWGRDRRGASSLAVRDAAGEGGGEVAFPDSGGAQVASFFKPPARENFKGKKQGVVVLSDVYGFRTENVRSTADFLADKGYHVLVPDMFQMRPWPPGKPMEEGFETWKARYAGPPERALAVVAGAGEFLRKGGCTEGRYNAGGAFYPTRFLPQEMGRIGAPLMVTFADQDPLVPAEMRWAVSDAMSVMKVPNKINVYVGRGHGFAHMPRRDNAVELEDAGNAMEEMFFFFSQHL